MWPVAVHPPESMRAPRDRCLRRVGFAAIPMVAFLSGAVPGPAFDQGADRAAPPPAEETRLSSAVFRAGLKKRGLTELLELHLKEFPPANPTQALLMMRDMKLAAFADASRPREERRAALAEANRLLKQVINDHPDDRRRFQWRVDLAHDLIYREAEPAITSILYHEGGPADRRRLRPLASRAVTILTRLSEDLAREYERLDGLSIRAFEKLDADGYVEQLDRVSARSEYLLLWALFYDALPREASDPVRSDQLRRVLERIEAKPAVVDTPHAASRVQIQALLLRGMTRRRLRRYQTAREDFDEALAVADRLDDPAERQRIAWAVTLARIERIRNDADEGRFDDALARLRHFRSAIKSESGDDFGLRLVAAILERSVYRRRATAAERAGQTAEAERFRLQAWQGLQELVRRKPRRRDELYGVLYEMIGPGADASRLDPLEQSALVAGLLFDAKQGARAADGLLDRAIRVGESFLTNRGLKAPSLVPEVLFNTATAYYRRGRPVEAARRFLALARDHPAFGKALSAATLAARIGAELYADPAVRSSRQVAALYREALRVLVQRYPDTEAARYWRFYYAQLLDEMGQFERAAAEYERVDATHEHYLESTFLRARCLGLRLRELSDQVPRDVLALQRRASDYFAAARRFLTMAGEALNRDPRAEQAAEWKHLSAQTRVMMAEVQVLPGIDRPAQALDTLARVDSAVTSDRALAGRIWRVRLLAHVAAGQFKQATQAIPVYAAADPENARATLQSLYLTLVRDLDRFQEHRDKNLSLKKAELALVLARQAFQSVPQTDLSAREHAQADAADPAYREATIQLAEANLRVGRYARARELLAPLAAEAAGSTPESGAEDRRVTLGLAEAKFHLGAFQEALPLFNRLATTLPPGDPVRWKSLLRDLQCRTALGHSPFGVIQVIEQQRRLYPGMGGPALSAQFNRLLRKNQRRADAKP